MVYLRFSMKKRLMKMLQNGSRLFVSVFWIFIGLVLLLYICLTTVGDDDSTLDLKRNSQHREKTSFNVEIHSLEYERYKATKYNGKSNFILAKTVRHNDTGIQESNREKSVVKNLDRNYLLSESDLVLASNGSYYGTDTNSLDLNSNIFKKRYLEIANLGARENATFDFYAFNVTASRKLSLHRLLPETRHSKCLDISFNERIETEYFKVSIIIPFHNEEYSVLLRTLHSIYSTTPSHLIHEVLLIDDFSDYVTLGQVFTKYVKLFPKLKFYRTKQRQGLIRTRILGARASSGNALIFLDAHIECQKDWIEPLLDILTQKPKSIAIPNLDYINPYTMLYTKWSRLEYGVFTWDLNFAWKDIPQRDLPADPTFPIASPVTIGCAIAIRRDYFFELGEYDEDMWIWGGEQLEVSFRSWMCGGGVYIAPCSHIGHLFRPNLPYSFPVPNAIAMNLQRVAEIWMGDYRPYFYQTTGKKLKLTRSQEQTLQTRIVLKDKLKCKSFEWYLDNVVNDMPIPTNGSYAFGQMTHMATRLCLSHQPKQGNTIAMTTCPLMEDEQWFSYKQSTNQIMHHSEKYCLTHSSYKNKLQVSFMNCTHDRNSHQKWAFYNSNHDREKEGMIYYKTPTGGDVCLSLERASHISSVYPTLVACSNTDPFQMWSFTYKLRTPQQIR